MGERERSIIIGLGNPGETYRDTRHNVGFWFIDFLAHQWDFPLFYLVDNVLLSKREVKGVDVFLAKPTTFMNRSGLALVTLSEEVGYENPELLVCHDDIDIPIGRFKLKRGGGSGGHKGVQSILDYVAGEDIGRLKFGILPDRKPRDVEAFVLSAFEKDEEMSVCDLFPLAMNAVECLLEEGMDKAMSLYNRDDSGKVDREE